MATPPKRWPLVSRPRSIQETDKDSTQESHESRNDPYGGAHKHGPACKGDFRAVIYPLSSQARSCCEAQPQEQGGSSPIVRLSQCEHSPYFSIGTEKLANVTLECLNNDAEESPQWQHPLQARIYPDPETFEVEILNYNVSPDLPLTVSSVTTGESIQLFRGDSCRLTVDDSWSLRVDDSHTFGLILRPKQLSTTLCSLNFLCQAAMKSLLIQQYIDSRLAVNSSGLGTIFRRVVAHHEVSIGQRYLW
jgi:hypothetical protein